MQHSYDGLDRGGGFSRVRLFVPLGERNYRLLCGGMAISLLGDGAFLVALAWQVYTLSNTPAALAAIGVAMTIPTIACLLLGGAVSDRFDRRHAMVAADGVRGATVGLIAALALTGALALWHLLALGAIYAAATAFFDPAFEAIVPEVLPPHLLPQANSLDQFIRPLALRLAGPAVGGVIVGSMGTGAAFGLDALSFVVSMVSVLSISKHHGPSGALTSVTAEIAAGLRYVRANSWLWATLLSAAIAYLLFLGPTEVLLPFIAKNSLHAGPAGLGLVFASGGLGSLLCAIAVGQRGLPKGPLRFMYCCWTAGTLAVAGYGLASALWGLMLASVAFNVLETAGTVAWLTVKQQRVPSALLGRVSSLDWLISIGLLPISYALTGPISATVGSRVTLIAAGALGALVTVAPLLMRSVRRIDQAFESPAPVQGAAVR